MTLSPPPAAEGECNWSEVPAKLPTVPECKRVVQNWTSSAPRAFAGMPRESDIGFEERLTRAHQDICEKVGVIVLDPKSPSAMTPSFSQTSWWAFMSLSSNPMSDSRGIPAKARGALLVQFRTTFLHSATVGSFAGNSAQVQSPSVAGGGVGVITLFVNQPE